MKQEQTNRTILPQPSCVLSRNREASIYSQ